MQGVISDNKRIARNTLFLYIRMFFVLIITLYTSRVVLNTLGISDYGVYNVVGGFVSLFGFINTTLSSSMSRFYNYECEKRREEGIMEVYTAGFWIHLLLASVVLILLETFGLWYINNVMVVPTDRLHAANVLFQCSVFSMILVILEIPYISVILSYERMDFYAIVSILDVFLKLIIVLALPYVPFDKLISYALLMSIITVADFLLYFIYAKKNFIALKLKKSINTNFFRSFLSFSGWNLAGTFAFMLKGQGVNMVINAFTGPIVNAARGVAFQVQSAISNFSNNIVVSFRPQIVNNYASGNLARSLRLVFLESKVCYSLLCIIVVPLIIEIHYVLHLWLGATVPENAELFAALVLIDMIICSLNTPLTQIAHASGDIRHYQMACSSVNILLVPVCWLLMKFGFNATSTFVCTIVFSIINQIVCLTMLHRILQYSTKSYVENVIFPCLLISLLLPVLPYYVHTLMPESFFRLLCVCLADLMTAFAVSYFVVLNRQERRSVMDYINKKRKKYE